MYPVVSLLGLLLVNVQALASHKAPKYWVAAKISVMYKNSVIITTLYYLLSVLLITTTFKIIFI